MKHLGMFEHYAKATMNEIMEKYLLIIYSKFLEYDPLSSVDYVEEYTRTIDSTTSATGKSNSESNSNSSGLGINNDTPQTNISKANILAGNYASNASATEQEAEGSDTTNTDEDYTKHVKGNSGVSATAQKMVEQYRNNIRAIDYEIILELNDLFMGLF